MTITESQQDHLTLEFPGYRLEWDLVAQQFSVWSQASAQLVGVFPMHSSLDTLEEMDQASGAILLERIEQQAEDVLLVFTAESAVWGQRRYLFRCGAASFIYSCQVAGDGQRLDTLRYCLARTAQQEERGAQAGFSQVYAPRFDWSRGKVHCQPGEVETLSCQQWLSPPPFCYAWALQQEWISCGIQASAGESNFVSYDYCGKQTPEQRPTFYLQLTYEGHTRISGAFETPGLVFGFGATEENAALASYIAGLVEQGCVQRTPKSIPAWWREPIFCGWGQQRADYRQDHAGSENGTFLNVGDYATETIYRQYVAYLEEQQLHPGTLIIDFKWAEQDALAQPSRKKWRDMRQFIDEQHEAGRKVLLWYAPFLAEGLPEEACMTLGGRIVAADPTSPVYQDRLARELYRMISADAGCLNADGLKIDFTQHMPTERGRFRCYLATSWALMDEENERYHYPPLGNGRHELIQTHSPLWGVELLKKSLETIYQAIKAAKPESVLIAHTANPSFADVVDILRLNDLDGNSADVLDIMQNRACLAHVCNPDWLIDTDNDLMVSKAAWRQYLQMQPQLGIPDTYYLWSIAASNEPLGPEDMDLLRHTWETYRRTIASS